jgi:hypothetical protein
MLRTTLAASFLLVSGGCGSLWAPFGEGELPPDVGISTGDAFETQDSASPLPETLEERFPFVRFIRHESGLVSGLVTVPAGEGDKVVTRLKLFCSCDDREIDPTIIERVPDVGGVFTGDPGLSPWLAKELNAMTVLTVEDVIRVTGSEEDFVEVFHAVDLWYNSSPQVEIRAEVYEITSSKAFERGIRPVGGNALFESTDSGSFIQGLGGGFASSSNPNYSLDNPHAGAGAGTGGVIQFGILRDEIQFQAFLQMLETADSVDILARPSMVVRNGVPATLTSTEEIPYLNPTGVSLQGVTGFTLQTKSAGVTLKVVPFLMGVDTIHLVIDAQVSRISRNVSVGTDTSGAPITIPSLTNRSAKTEVYVRSGQRVVIGGLKNKEERTVTNKFPILGDIPLLGWLFSSEERVTVDTEVLFVIQPRVTTRGATISPFGEIFDPFEEGP